MLKSLADGQKSKETTEVPLKKEDQYVPDESDSTKSRRLAEDYDSTKNGMDYGKYQGTHTCHRAPRSDSLVCDLCPPSVAKGRPHAACSCVSLAGHQADILRKSRQEETRERDGDQRRQIVKDRTRACRRGRLSSPSETLQL